MILVDSNLLLYAYDRTSAQHERSREWLERVLSGVELVRFSWLALWAFVRISTNPRVFQAPLLPAEAMEIVAALLEKPCAGILDPGERHATILDRLVREGQCTGPLIMDAALAAIAMEHGATLCSTDRDFTRFAGLSLTNPLA